MTPEQNYRSAVQTALTDYETRKNELNLQFSAGYKKGKEV